MGYTEATIAEVNEQMGKIKDEGERKAMEKKLKQFVQEKKEQETDDRADDDDEEYNPTTDASVDINQEVEDRQLSEKIGKYLDAVKRIKDEDGDDENYSPTKDEQNYTKDDD